MSHVLLVLHYFVIIMPFRCSVPRCRGNYNNGPKVSVFSFPKEAVLRQKWISAIHRQDFQPTDNSKVCELHFHDTDIVRMVEHYDERSGRKLSANLSIPKLREGSIPSILPGCPSYLSTENRRREGPSVKKVRLENSQFEAGIAASLASQEEYEAKFSYSSLEGLLKCLNNVTLPNSWVMVQKADCISFVCIVLSPYPNINVSLVVEENLEVKLFKKHVSITTLGNRLFPKKISNVNELIEIITDLNHFELGSSADNLVNHISLVQDSLSAIKIEVGESGKDIISFISEQLSLLTCHKNRNKFSSSLLILCSLLFSISPHAYRFLRNSGFVTLPHSGTLRRICGVYRLNPQLEQFNSNFLMYARQKFQFLEAKDKNVILLMDEIHLKSYLDYKGGSILGASYNCEQAAASAHVFMIQSIRSCYRDVVHILPVKTIVANFLFEVLCRIIRGLEDIGFSVLCISSDNNAINRRAVSMFSKRNEINIVYQHPVNPARPLFFLIDAVHIIKCVRNNWLNQKDEEKSMIYPYFPIAEKSGLISNVASLKTIRNLYNLECTNLVKYAHTLTEKALFPSSLERQNVKLVLQLFNNSVAEGLEIAGEKYNLDNYSSTAEYIRIMCRWFDVMNVRQIFKGKNKLNIFQEPVTVQENDERIIFLHNFLDWLQKWEEHKPLSGFFTKETLLALKQTSYAVIEIARYCSEELGMEYLLTGKLQTDALEDRFGRYRQLAGSQYQVSVVQIYESEVKLRLQSLLPLLLNSSSQGKLSVASIDDVDYSTIVNLQEVSTFQDRIFVTEEDISNLKEFLPSLAYISGYCAHSALKKLSCVYCKDNLIIDKDLEVNENFILIKSLDRGGLKYPSDETLSVVCYSYVVISKLLSSEFEEEFLQLPNQRIAVCHLTWSILNDIEECLMDSNCPLGHTPSKRLIWASTNILLANYCKNVNNSLASKKYTARKMKTFK